MFKFLKDRKKKDNKGFTLVELVIVVAILAILVGILAPQYTKYVEKSRKAADASNLENMVTAFKTAASDGTDSVEAGTYSIEIKTAGTEFKKGADAVAATSDLGKLMISYAGKDWQKTKLKSQKWTTDGKLTSAAKQTIKADITVGNDGSVTVVYTPDTIKDQTNQ